MDQMPNTINSSFRLYGRTHIYFYLFKCTRLKMVDVEKTVDCYSFFYIELRH